MTRPGAGRHRPLANPLETAVGEAEHLDSIDAEIGCGDEAAGRVEDDAVRMWRFLAVLVQAAANVLDLPAHGAEPSVGLDRQDDEIAADIVGDDQVASGRIDRQMGRDRAVQGLAIELLDRPAAEPLLRPS
jgi:hypothetical protein